MATPNSPWPTRLHELAHAGDAAEIAAILPSSDQNIKTEKGDTALHLAALGGHEAALSLLLNAQPAPDANATNAQGWTPLMLALLSSAPPAQRLGCVTRLLLSNASAGVPAPDLTTSPLWR